MKKIIVLILILAATTAALLATFAGGGKQVKSVEQYNSILGTWELKLYKYGYGNPKFKEYPKDKRQIELITDNYFTWVRIDTATKKIYSSATGKYTYDGNNFIVTVEYGLAMDDYLGVVSNYTVKVENNFYFLSGELVDGYLIEEVWERIK